MKGFKCIGLDCEETCCSGWSVIIDEDHYKKLKRAMDQTQAQRREFGATHKRVDIKKRSRLYYATLCMRKDGYCGLLDADGLCSVQLRFGEQLLSDTCALYPRTFSATGSRIEMAGTLSCPEITRRVLFAADALELVDMDPRSLPEGRNPPVQKIDPKNLYAGYVDDIRTTMYELLSLPEYPLSARLFFAAYFASRTVGFFFKGCESVDEQRLGNEIRRVKASDVLAELYEQYLKLAPSETLVAAVIVRILAQKASGACYSSFRTLVGDVFNIYARPSVEGPENLTFHLPTDKLISDYYQRKEEMTARFGQRIERYFENYAKNYWMKEWYGDSINLLVHTENLLVRIAVLRFMLFSLVQIPPGTDADEAVALLDKSAVQIFTRFSRNIEHDRKFLDNLTRALDEEKMQTLAHSICFLKF